MARRRYLSSAISTDKLVNRLALDAGDFAALLYTWMIPHAADNATLTGDPEELLMQVFPGRRDKEPEDVAQALAAMAELGLITWDDCGCVRFPASFYKHQTYISAERREVAETAQNAADQRRSAQNGASFKSSFSSKSSLKLEVEDPNGSHSLTQNETKNPTYSNAFLAFWRQYPTGHGSKKVAFEVWQRLRPNDDLQLDILASLAKWNACEQWQQGFIKDAERFLRNRMWEVEPPPPKPVAAPRKTAAQQSSEYLLRIARGEQP